MIQVNFKKEVGIFKYLFRLNKRGVLTIRETNQNITPITSIRRRYMLLGKEYRVRVVGGSRNSLKIEGSELLITLHTMSLENFESYFEGWYRRQARRIFQESLQKLDKDQVEPRIKIYCMTRAWGRCYYRKRLITLNLYLAKCPRELIEYIIQHELCHFKHPNHSREFYAELTDHLPNWREMDNQIKGLIKSEAKLLRRLHI